MTYSTLFATVAAISFSAFAQGQSPTDCPKDKARELPSSLKTAVAREKLGVETYLSRQFGSDQMIIAILAPVAKFTCSGGTSSDGKTDRHVLIWQRGAGGWRQVARNSEIVYPLDQFGEISISIEAISNGARLIQSASAPRYEQTDSLTFRYDKTFRALRLTQWLTKSFRNENGPGPRGDKDNQEILEKRSAENPNVSIVDGHEGEANFLRGTAWIKFLHWAEVPKLRRFKVTTNPISLTDAKWPFPQE